MAFFSNSFSILLILWIGTANYACGKIIPNENTLKCEFYEEFVCTDPQNNCTSPIIDESNEEENFNGQITECSDGGRENYCFALWSNDSLGRITVKKKGCMDDVNCEGRTLCISTEKRRSLYYCCCDGDLCNSNFYFDPELLDDEIDEQESSSLNGSLNVIIPVLVIITCCGLLITFFYSFCKRKSCNYDQNANFNPKSQSDSSASLEKLLPIELIEVKAKGRFGEVWKAFSKIKNEYVAVKIFPSEDKQSWLTEQEVFKLPHMEHENILQFIGAEKRYDSPLPKYWLITAYHERGSLCEYLKNNTVTWEQLCLISFTMARGLAHLHDEKMPLKASDFYKPPIAHRDFKSSNVLLKEDLTACIADFGLAIIFKDSQLEGNNHRRQVGTRRYMAPEILHGWMNFSATAFQYVDVYACGLVLWEILSRCTVHEYATSKYKLPFEEELGEHPTIDEMRELVVNNKLRPEIKESWKNHPLLSEICETIEECWDPDPEARASASCVAERFSSHLRSTVKCETKLLYNNV